ncbi:MAG: hypothetical protein K8U03_00625 [Planctomycetia bacterium]|nr:hypothetical protein [Planctomycetia bacterium]
MTDSETFPTTTSAPGDIELLLNELEERIVTGGDPLKDSIRRLDLLVRDRFRKDPLQQLVARIGSAAALHDNAFGLFSQALGMLDTSVSTEAAIRGLLLSKAPNAHRYLLHDLIVCRLVSNDLEAASPGKRHSAEVFRFSKPLLRDLRKKLNDDFAFLGVRVWDRAIDRRSDPCWCDAWAQMSLDLLTPFTSFKHERGRDIAEPYLDRICQIDHSGIRGIVPLLMCLSELSPFSSQYNSKIRQAPIGTELIRQFGELLRPISTNVIANFDPSRQLTGLDAEPAFADSVKQNSVGAWEEALSDLPEPVKASINALFTFLRSLPRNQQTTSDQLKALRHERQSLQEEIGQLQISLQLQESRISELRSDLNSAREQRDAEATRRAQLEHSYSVLQTTMAQAEKELRTTKEDYERLTHRSDRQLAQIRQHALDGLGMDLRQTWELMASMLEKVVRGEREPRHLAGIWNQLDEILWQQIGGLGHPIKAS